MPCLDNSWNIRNFGPLYIPRKGDTLVLNASRNWFGPDC